MCLAGACRPTIADMISRDSCAARDAADALAPLRSLFALERIDAEGVIYLDGNSLGVLPAAAPARIREVAEVEWGEGLIRSWNSAGWITLSQRIGDKIARLIGARPGEVAVADSTSINLHKVLNSAIALCSWRRGFSPAVVAAGSRDAAPRILSERTTFPTDLSIADTLARQHGFTLALIDD